MSFRLTERQHQMVELMGSGHTDRETYLSLQISERTFDLEWSLVKDQIHAGSPTTLEDFKLLVSYERIIRQRIAHELRATEARLAALMDTSPQAILVINGLTGIILKANNRAFTLFGYSPKELLNKPMEILIDRDLSSKHEALRTGFMRSIRKREMGYHPPIYAKTKAGEILDLDIALTATIGTDDVMVVIRDDSSRAISELHPSETGERFLA